MQEDNPPSPSSPPPESHRLQDTRPSASNPPTPLPYAYPFFKSPPKPSSDKTDETTPLRKHGTLLSPTLARPSLNRKLRKYHNFPDQRARRLAKRSLDRDRGPSPPTPTPSPTPPPTYLTESLPRSPEEQVPSTSDRSRPRIRITYDGCRHTTTILLSPTRSRPEVPQAGDGADEKARAGAESGPSQQSSPDPLSIPPARAGISVPADNDTSTSVAICPTTAATSFGPPAPAEVVGTLTEKHIEHACEWCTRAAAIVAELAIRAKYKGRIKGLGVWIQGLKAGRGQVGGQLTGALYYAKIEKRHDLLDLKALRLSEIKKAWAMYEEHYGHRPMEEESSDTDSTSSSLDPEVDLDDISVDHIEDDGRSDRLAHGECIPGVAVGDWRGFKDDAVTGEEEDVPMDIDDGDKDLDLDLDVKGSVDSLVYSVNERQQAGARTPGVGVVVGNERIMSPRERERSSSASHGQGRRAYPSASLDAQTSQMAQRLKDVRSQREVEHSRSGPQKLDERQKEGIRRLFRRDSLDLKTKIEDRRREWRGALKDRRTDVFEPEGLERVHSGGRKTQDEVLAEKVRTSHRLLDALGKKRRENEEEEEEEGEKVNVGEGDSVKHLEQLRRHESRWRKTFEGA